MDAEYDYRRIALCAPSKIALKEDVEIYFEAPLVVAEKDAVLRIGDVGMHIERIEMIGQVEAAHREAHRVFLRDLKIFRDAHIEREEIREARLIGVRRADVILLRISHRIRKAIAVFDHRREAELPRQA